MKKLVSYSKKKREKKKEKKRKKEKRKEEKTKHETFDVVKLNYSVALFN